ncbi:hypothetical protein H8K47_03090 [Undibacterium sp. CY7W]|uniref:Uncharacterized protein n=1 Tax=Undibacterium rugosum TaxID=2762291 RepID=A0A923KYD3_9BURK|nr:hypothetical protein [Undibacterium rugosum]MBC3934340.1 hypothetical protein [Undibacterium rugosum]
MQELNLVETDLISGGNYQDNVDFFNQLKKIIDAINERNRPVPPAIPF